MRHWRLGKDMECLIQVGKSMSQTEHQGGQRENQCTKGAKEASGRLLYLHGWKLWSPKKAMVIPGIRQWGRYWTTSLSLAMWARPEQLIAVMRGALLLIQPRKSTFLQQRVLPSQSKLC